ncbi:sigma-70 family RNA polymerase sigma factor [Sphingomonas sp. GM_Shp_1]|uniref:RNA polymerase sigma factor n=1 Tax=Sphingomonas sp. GM_Shp_1 TaxID=2937381 RepID=UPI00226BB525|nr:sigma-70 family RNA polymerase sigma factor [Sphingomonas sp. GM_Shp_1]
MVARAQMENDGRAFEELVRRHQGMVRAQLRRLMNGDEAGADDLAQETFVLAWRKLRQFRGDARFSTWLYRIAYSCFLQARRKSVDAAGAHDDDATQPTPAPLPTDLQIDIANALRRLPIAEQTVLLHSVQLGLSHEETAYVLSMPLGTVKSHAARGKARLRALLSDWQPLPKEGARHVR